MIPSTYMIEGIDRLGKSTLINNIRQNFGFYQVIHCQKPELLACNVETAVDLGMPAWFDGLGHEDKLADLQHPYLPEALYQNETFVTLFEIARSNAAVIFDRAHLGECVYAPMYRKYSGDYVFDLEESYGMDEVDHVKLILLVEDFTVSRHFVDDGLSLGSIEKREAEQNLFIQAFNRSIIKNKKMVCVTDQATGKFRDQMEIFREAT